MSTLSHFVSDSIPLATITTDTGTFAPGNTDFRRFTSPGMCLAAARTTRDLLRHSQKAAEDHALHDVLPAGDTVPVRAITVARACGDTKFTVNGVAPQDLLDFFALALIAGHDSLAHAILVRRLSLATDSDTRDSVRQQSIEAYLAAEPARIAAAETVIAQIDSMGTQEPRARLWAHFPLMFRLMQRNDLTLMRREAERLIAVGQEVPLRAIRYDDLPLIAAYIALGKVAYIEQPDSIMAIMGRAKLDLQRFPTADQFPPGITWVPLQLIHYRQLSIDQVRDVLMPYNIQQYGEGGVPPLQTKFWSPVTSSVWPPGKGHVSLVFASGELTNYCARDEGGLLGNVLSPGNFCRALYTFIPQWMRRYGTDLSITFVLNSQGNAVRSHLLSPAEEIDSLGWFFRSRLKMPVTVAMVQDSIWQLPAIDGRRFYIDTSEFRHLEWKSGLTGHEDGVSKYFAVSEIQPVVWSSPFSFLIVLLYDEHGVLRYVGRDIDNPYLDALLSHLLAPAHTAGR